MAPALLGCALFIGGECGFHRPLVAGVVAATLVYAWTHDVAHISDRPRTAWGGGSRRTICGIISGTREAGSA